MYEDPPEDIAEWLDQQVGEGWKEVLFPRSEGVIRSWFAPWHRCLESLGFQRYEAYIMAPEGRCSI